MDEVNVKRDARRRRILENSEKRLSKITGRNCHSEVKDSVGLSEAITNIEERDFERNANGAVPGDTRDKIHASSNRRLNNENIEPENACGTPNIELNSKKVHGGSQDTNMYRLSENIENAKTSVSSGTLPLPHLLLSTRINYVLLAVLVNVLLILRLDHLFGKTIFIPYVTMMLGRLYAYKDTWKTQGSNLVFAALTLCNIKPELKCKFKKLASLLNIISGDSAVYIFSFTLIYYGISYYLHDIYIPITVNS